MEIKECREEEVEMDIILEDLDPEKKKALEEAMVWSIIEASLNEIEDSIIETNLGVAPVRPIPLSKTDERVIEVVLFESMDKDRIKNF